MVQIVKLSFGWTIHFHQLYLLETEQPWTLMGHLNSSGINTIQHSNEKAKNSNGEMCIV